MRTCARRGHLEKRDHKLIGSFCRSRFEILCVDDKKVARQLAMTGHATKLYNFANNAVAASDPTAGTGGMLSVAGDYLLEVST